MACKQKDVKRPQGWARDDVKVIITGPLETTALMFFWWSRALQQGRFIYCMSIGMKAHLKRKNRPTQEQLESRACVENDV